MGIVGIIVPNIEVTANTLKVERFGILVVMQVSNYPFIRDTLWKQVLVAFHARLVWNILYRVFQFRLFIPIDTFNILCKISPYVPCSQGYFRGIVRPRVVGGRQMAVDAIHRYPA